MNKGFILCFAIALLSFSACQDKKASSAKDAPKAAPVSLLNEEGTMKLVNMLMKYYELKNALVKSDGTEASIAAEKLALLTTDVQVFSFSDSALNTQIGTPLDTIQKQALFISQTHPADVEAMRTSFEFISNNLFVVMKKTEMKNANIYRQFCPMAFNDKGAFWLSEEADIKNPYFGNKMLICGEVTDSL